MNKRIRNKMMYKRPEVLTFNTGKHELINMRNFDFKNATRRGLPRDEIVIFRLLCILNEYSVYFKSNDCDFKDLTLRVPMRCPGSKETKKSFRKRWYRFANELDDTMREYDLTRDDLLVI